MKYKVQCKYVVTKDHEGNIIEEGEKKYYIVSHRYTQHNGQEIWEKVRINRSCPAFNTKEEAMQALKKITYREIVEENHFMTEGGWEENSERQAYYSNN